MSFTEEHILKFDISKGNVSMKIDVTDGILTISITKGEHSCVEIIPQANETKLPNNTENSVIPPQPDMNKAIKSQQEELESLFEERDKDENVDDAQGTYYKDYTEFPDMPINLFSGNTSRYAKNSDLGYPDVLKPEEKKGIIHTLERMYLYKSYLEVSRTLLTKHLYLYPNNIIPDNANIRTSILEKFRFEGNDADRKNMRMILVNLKYTGASDEQSQAFKGNYTIQKYIGFKQ